MSCGVVCVFIVFICQNGLQLSNAEENATTIAEQPTTKPSTPDALAQDPAAEDRTTQNSTALNATAADSSTKNPPIVDLSTPKSETREGNTTENLEEVVTSKEPPKLVALVEDDLPTQTKNDSTVTPTAISPQTAEDKQENKTSREETKKEEISTASSTDDSKLSKDATTATVKKTNEDEPNTKDDEKVKQEIKATEKSDVELSTTAPPKEVRNDIEKVVSHSVDSAKGFAGDAYNAMRSAFSNVINK
ncbi:uncharacterized protein LOC118271178 isoform X3 [Spodoptera frugiperda]|uniref:Uncharacterized protein LOC118271178 isoform X3 n=1 Tax=Spodoptera frugiperda TaxID=7108 RepID=A0A9R0D779_SPOFR|nr:uncharacterized protein LOC118271178 isoform X3 [Spodoptera frugiperda]